MNKMFNKSDFDKLQHVGQFNLGFILATLGNKLFILDQHACDEKYNFEDLSLNTEIHSQTLLKPIEIELSVAEILTLNIHEDTFAMNGFKVTKRNPEDDGDNIWLIKTLPYSKNVQFNVDDFYDLMGRCQVHLDANPDLQKEA